jgi:hypothetical protein
MSGIICLLGVILCNLSTDDIPINTNHGVDASFDSNGAFPLKAQLVNVPRVYNSPCPNKFRYTFDGKEWRGLLMIKHPARKGIDSKTKVVLSVGFHYSSVWL